VHAPNATAALLANPIVSERMFAVFMMVFLLEKLRKKRAIFVPEPITAFSFDGDVLSPRS